MKAAIFRQRSFRATVGQWVSTAACKSRRTLTQNQLDSTVGNQACANVTVMAGFFDCWQSMLTAMKLKMTAAKEKIFNIRWNRHYRMKKGDITNIL